MNSGSIKHLKNIQRTMPGFRHQCGQPNSVAFRQYQVLPSHLVVFLLLAISSITMTCNELLLASPLHAANSNSASLNRPRINFSDPPTQRSSSSGAATIFGSLAFKALLISLANAVFPQPLKNCELKRDTMKNQSMLSCAW